MSARLVAVLFCDGPGCAERFMGTQALIVGVRREAAEQGWGAKVTGTVADRQTTTDTCPLHVK